MIEATLRPIRVARISTVPFFIVTQLGSQLDALVAGGYDVTVVTSSDKLGSPMRAREGVRFLPLEIPRHISPLNDLRAFFGLVRLFRRERFDIVHSTTPKAGLLCALAGRVAGVPVRLHTFTGQPWVSLTGLKQKIAKACDAVIGRLNTACYADSASQRQFLVENGIAHPERISVVGEGSVAGVDLRRFDPDRFDAERKRELRAELGIPESGVVVLFAGRVTRDKGVLELKQAFEMLLEQGLDAWLVVIGPFEPDGEPILPRQRYADPSSRVKLLGFRDEPEAYMAIADVFCLPSYREGFGTVVIESAAMGIPTVGTDIYGLSDSVVNGETGLLVPPRDPRALFEALKRLVVDLPLRQQMGREARRRAREAFSGERVNKLVLDEYERLVARSVKLERRGAR